MKTVTRFELLGRVVRVGAAVLTLTGISMGAPLDVHAQQSRKLYRIGFLERTSMAMNAANLAAFREGLHQIGDVDGKSYTIEYRSVDGRDERYPELVAELISLKVDVIVTRGTPGTMAAKRATTSIPIIVTSIGDPVGQGVVASLARPGGNVTGMTSVATDLYRKRVELLRELVPAAKRIAALLNMETSDSASVARS